MITVYIAKKVGNKIVAAEAICHDEGSHIRLLKPYAGMTTFEVGLIGAPRAISVAHTEVDAKKLVMKYYEDQVANLKANSADYSSQWPGVEEYIRKFNKRGFKHVSFNNIKHDLLPAVQIVVAPSLNERTLRNTFQAVGSDFREACENMKARLKEENKW